MTMLKHLALLVWTALSALVQADVSLAVAGRSNSTPWIAASGSHVAVAWGAAADGGKTRDVYVAVSTDGGRTFGNPVRVNSAPGEARINGEIAPRVALAAQQRTGAPLMTVTWNARDSASHIKSARSLDGGRTFAAPVTLETSGAAGDRGWQAATLDSRGTLHSIWLDHRGMAAGADHSMHKGEHDGVAMAQRSGLYYRASGAERELFKGVCYCCKTALATGPKDEIYAAWRHVFAGNMRDMGFTMSRDGGRTFSPLTRVNQDGWSIQGCPDDGPAMAVDATGTVHLAWPTVKNEQGVILYATSRDGGAFSAPARITTLGGPKPSHPQIAVTASGRVFIAWDESKDGVRSAAIGLADGSQPPLVLGPATSYPVMAAIGDGVVAAWTAGPPHQSVIKVRRIGES